MSGPVYAPQQDLDAIALMLRDLGYRGLTVNDPELPHVETSMSGYSVWVMIHMAKSIQLRAVFVTDPNVTTLERMNDFNFTWRYAKVYKSDKTMVCECDFLFDLSDASALETLKRIVLIYEGALARAVPLLHP